MWLKSSELGSGLRSVLLLLVAWGVVSVYGASTLEKREMGVLGPMPPGLAGPGIGIGALGGGQFGGNPMSMGAYGPPQMGAPQIGGPPGGASPYGGSYEQGPPYAGPPGQYGAQQPPYPPFGYKDPGFSVQTGFEGFLVPNSWYGLLPWGIEGVVIVIVGIIVAMVIVVSIVALLVWLTGFGDFALVKEQARRARSYLPSSSYFSMDTLNQLTSNVLDALDRYNELVKHE